MEKEEKRVRKRKLRTEGMDLRHRVIFGIITKITTVAALISSDDNSDKNTEKRLNKSKKPKKSKKDAKSGPLQLPEDQVDTPESSRMESNLSD
jgi:hypothetical protein